MTNIVFRKNNLDLIRLFAATQVCFLHTFEFMFAEKTGTLFFEFIRLFPGVPIFFFISGFLISKSYESSPNIGKYAKNRILRIYPALIIVVLINIILVWATGYFDPLNINFLSVLKLFLAKSTFLQFYNPDFMRGFGDGVLNGSLWTICVELQFYIITPILYLIFGKNRHISNSTLLFLICFFILINRILYGLAPQASNEIWWKLFRVSFAPWIYMFLVGILAQRNFNLISTYIRKFWFPAIFVIYCFIAYFSKLYGLRIGNDISPVLFFLLISVVLSASYYKPYFFNNILKGNDISYGVYIWHMPILNLFLFYGIRSEYWHAISSIMITYIIAIISWMYIEKPSLKLKDYSIKKRQ